MNQSASSKRFTALKDLGVYDLLNEICSLSFSRENQHNMISVLCSLICDITGKNYQNT